MYATRSLSQSLHAATKGMLKIVNDLISEPPEGPFSGYLLLQEEEDSSGSSSCASCWGICKDKRVKGPPFPQNKCLHVTNTVYQELQSLLTSIVHFSSRLLASPCLRIYTTWSWLTASTRGWWAHVLGMKTKPIVAAAE